MADKFGLPEKGRTWSAHALWLRVPAFLLLGQFALTCWAAFTFRGSPGLGAPLLHLGTFPVYPPWQAVLWYPRLPSHYGLTFAFLFLLSTLFPLALALRKKGKRDRIDHGSAKKATFKEIKAAGLLDKTLEGGVYVGAVKDKSGRVHYLRDPFHRKNGLVWAPTGAGKGVSSVIPTANCWRDSMVVLDIKGENWHKSAGWRQRIGNRVLRYDPTSHRTISYNPLAAVRLNTDHDVADAQNIAFTMSTSEPGWEKENPHWRTTAQSLLTAGFLHVSYCAQKDGRQGSITDLADELASADASDDWRDTMNNWLNTHHASPGHSWRGRFGPTTTHPQVAAGASEMLKRTDTEAASVLSTTLRLLSLYRDPLIANATRRSDIHPEDLRDPDIPTTLYLTIPPGELQRLAPLLILLLDQFIGALTRDSTANEKKRRVLFLLDEFASLGKLPILERALSYCTGHGVHFLLFVQDLSQLYAAYGQNESITGNCHYRIAYTPNKPQTAELLSRMAGTTTVVTKGKKGAPAHAHSRPLLTADECMRLPMLRTNKKGKVTPGDSLIFSAGLPMIHGSQILYFQDPVLASRAAIPPPEEVDARPQSPPLPHQQAAFDRPSAPLL